LLKKNVEIFFPIGEKKYREIFWQYFFLLVEKKILIIFFVDKKKSHFAFVHVLRLKSKKNKTKKW